MSLNTDLKDFMENIRRTKPSFVVKYVESVVASLKEGDVESKALNVGDKLPGSNLMNHIGKHISFYDLLNDQPAIISFYRGAWCPFCNLELKAYDRLLADTDVNMYAISPEKPDATLSVEEVEKLNFEVLSDPSNKFAKAVGLIFKVPFLYRLKLRVTGTNLNKKQGNRDHELPIPATYVIDGSGIIRYAWVDADYRHRAEPQEVIDAYNSVKPEEDKLSQ